MAEERKEFTKTKEMSVEDVKNIINTDFGVKLKVQDIKVGHHVIMKILKPVEENNYQHAGEDKISYNFWCKYKPRGHEESELMVQVGEGAVNRLLEKYPDDSYVDKYCFFSRTQYEGKYPQFINPMKSYNEPVDKEDLFKKKSDSGDKETTTADSGPQINLTGFDSFKEKYFALVKKSDMTPNAVHMLGSFIASNETARVKELLEKCKKSVE